MAGKPQDFETQKKTSLASTQQRNNLLRSWWNPNPPLPLEGERSELLEAHKECSLTVRRTMMTLLGFSIFCVLATFGTGDSQLFLAGTKQQITIPLANIEIAFVPFLIVAPLLLIVITAYLHVFIGYWYRLDAALETKATGAERLPTMLNIDAFIPRLLAGMVFYWLVPLVSG